ncbi:MAG: sugar kinase [Anaerolineae bacterium]|nr:sugar kinase [Anaerolineae bacterium]MDW8099536.1 sugar kinase [Anaerolineae bacterium]
MPEVITLGEALVEIMRPGIGQPLHRSGTFLGPYPSGAPAIFADAVARLGVSCGFIGCVGVDPFGDCLIDRLRADGVDVTYLARVPDVATGVAFVAYREDGSRQFVFHIAGAAAGRLGPEQVDAEYIQSGRWLHITGSSLSVNEPMRQACYRAVELATQAGLMISFDPNLRVELMGAEEVRRLVEPVLTHAAVVLPSGAEARLLTGINDDVQACRALLARGARIVALKRGAEGSVIFTDEGQVHVPGFRVAEVDPTGAGDCYAAGLAVALLWGWEIERAARFANAVGALAVTRQGPMEGAPFRGEVERLLSHVS